ncbi:MAG: ATP-binding protein [Planctomycetota bacterium]
MDALVQSLQDGILVLDETKQVVLVNRIVLELTGLSQEVLLSCYLPDLAPKNDLIQEMIQHLNEDPSTSNESIHPIRIIKENKQQFFKVEIIHIKTSLEGASARTQEKFIGYLILLKNVTQYQERDVAKTNLITTLSHELKTPLSSINLSLKLLEDVRLGELNTEQQNMVRSLRHQSQRLSKVIHELLEFSQIESGNIQLKFTFVKPDDIIDLAVSSLILLISEKDIHLETDIEDPLPLVQADFEKTVWVMINLINNAIRYSSKKGTIKLGVKRDLPFVQFFIQDHGPGIAKEEQGRLFQRFVQVGQKSKQGWGLGLAISKEFVQAQGGKIWVESEIGQGSTFYFTLPIPH